MGRRDSLRKFGEPFHREDLLINQYKKHYIKKYVEMMKAENVSRAVLVLQQNLTPFARSFLQELEPKIHLEIFQANPERQEVIAAVQFHKPGFVPMSIGTSTYML
ncbi:hypothetical protein GUJ93_ZPchr0007g3498 [Zizania palustris]|uniref:Uncharacterized protein n=1 Tax=Zizania palustris TaxID=103762 RepID=A0A8J5VN41_ZIZPA|nr:hypothetical protein GUJ93_ZPchr0007g3498 [Zizania palustris]